MIDKLKPEFKKYIEDLFEQWTDPRFLRYTAAKILAEYRASLMRHQRMHEHAARVKPQRITADIKRMRKAAKYQRLGIPEVKG